NPHHMGIYIGDGAYIHAPRTGDVIKISPMSRSDYLTARRVK
ncbi:NlpC/P60 family protein, partial [Clostridium sp. DJ247]